MVDRGAGLGIVAAAVEVPAPGEPWGHGGWLPPEKREALDWLTLGALLGWKVEAGADPGAWNTGRDVLVLARDPESMSEREAALLDARLQAEPLLFVARAARQGDPLAALSGVFRGPAAPRTGSLEWPCAGGRASSLRSPITLDSLSLSGGARPWATLDGSPAAVVRSVGRGVVATLAVHPSAARDSAGVVTRLLCDLLTRGSPRPVAWLDLERTLVLRMDDPGGSQNVHSRGWCYAKLGKADWVEIAKDLRHRHGRLSVLYTPGWVDDGDESRGLLTIDGRAVRRSPGQVWDSPRVRYEAADGHSSAPVSDYRSEFEGIEVLRRAGLGDVELHGHTHLHPDSDAWLEAPDRYESSRWYRELGRSAAPAIARLARHPVENGVTAIERIFGRRPTTLVPPGDEFTDEVVKVAHRLGLSFVASYYLALRVGDRFCWCQHVCAPYLDQPSNAWFDAGLPTVGYFHDYEPSIHGVGWMTEQLDAWQGDGADRLIDFRELAGAVCRTLRLEETPSGRLLLRVESNGGPALVRPLRVRLRADTLASRTLAIEHDDIEMQAELSSADDGVAVVEVPV